ncbi:DUF4913 domain-containing protein [Nocardia carnea]|uniref:DUF4913 domain-containing protein n=1 Tax=Nocardia carnea TaxID=37328 RepID=UPI0003115702|nr:DUF4913 domain-containing protein [Nocardia carnea]
MDDQQIDTEVARQIQALVAKTAAKKLAQILEADPDLARTIETQAQQTAEAQLARLAAEAAQSAAPRRFAHVGEWVDEYLSYAYWRDVEGIGDSDLRWCAHWGEHPEAAERLGPLFQRYLELSGTPEGMLSWWEDADHAMTKLMAKNGPFSRCSPGKHYDGEDAQNLHCEPAPDEIVQQWTAL